MTNPAEQHIDIAATMDRIGENARRAAERLAATPTAEKNAALNAAAQTIRRRQAEILTANARDVAAARDRGLSAAMLDRLQLDEQRVESMAAGIEAIAALPDPVGERIDEWRRPNGLLIQRVRVPLGVIGIVYESRPNVTADAAALCLKSGNAVILRGGSESFFSNRTIHACLVEAIADRGLPSDAVQMVPTTDRAAVGYLLADMAAFVGVVVPRGGRSLAPIRRVGRFPVLFRHMHALIEL